MFLKANFESETAKKGILFYPKQKIHILYVNIYKLFLGAKNYYIIILIIYHARLYLPACTGLIMHLITVFLPPARAGKFCNWFHSAGSARVVGVRLMWLGLGSGLFICRRIGTPTLSLTCRNSIAVVRQWTNKKWTTHRHVCSSFLSNKIVFCFIFNMGNFSEENIPPERSILRQGHMKNLCDLWLDMWDSLTGRQQW